jgi:hypothetical protein
VVIWAVVALVPAAGMAVVQVGGAGAAATVGSPAIDPAAARSSVSAPAIAAVAAAASPADSNVAVGAAAASGRAAAGVPAAASIRRGAWAKPATRVNRLVLVGDSLAQEVTPYLQFLTPGKTFVPKFWGGTAPCDWRDVNLQANRSTVVVITFTGNTLTECMSDGEGGHLVDEALVERYRHDIGVLIDKARRVGARVVLVGQPLRAASFDADVEVNGINEVYQDYAAMFPYVSFVDAGRAVETADGQFTDRLPCTPYDTDCAADGTTVVRGDGVHFCPIVGENPCSVWSSGAFRFALVIASGANNPRVFD